MAITERSPEQREQGDNDNGGTVTIPLATYEKLCADRQQVSQLRDIGLLDGSNELGLFSHDPEMAIFIAARYGYMTPVEVARSAAKRYGFDRKPSVYAIQRFWLRFGSSLRVDESEF